MSLRALRSAVGFLTIVPVSGGTDGRLGRAWFPVVGALLGAAAGAVLAGAGALTTPLLGAVAGVATLAVLTGGLHLDGLADAADGLLGGRDRERRLEIMRDSRVGSFGAIALGLVLLGEVAALAGLPPPRAALALVVAGALSRCAMLWLLAWLPYARPAGLGLAAAGGRRPLDLALGSAVAVAACLLDWRRSLIALPLAAVATAGVALLAWRRIGGATGDVYGAASEVCQLAALTAFAVRS